MKEEPFNKNLKKKKQSRTTGKINDRVFLNSFPEI